MKTTTIIHKTYLALALAAMGAGLSSPAHAFKFDLDNGITGSFDSTLSFGVQRRMQSTNRSMVGNDNGGNVPTSGRLVSYDSTLHKF